MAESKAFPWIKHLPQDDVVAFMRELRGAVDNIRHGTQSILNNVDVILAAWQSTAAIHANPVLLKVLTESRDLEKDFVDAPRPEARLLSCGWCYEENGEEVHPHPECTVGASRRNCSGTTELYGETVKTWCNKFSGHEGDHVSRSGHHWPNSLTGPHFPDQRDGGHDHDDI